jgi:hypothetical protein
VSKYYECLIPADLVDERWHDCAAIRFLKLTADEQEPVEEGTVEITGQVEMEISSSHDPETAA